MEESTPILFWHVFSMTLSPILWRNSELQYDVLYWFPIMTTALVPLRLGLGSADCSSSLMPSIERCLSWHSLPVLEVFHSLKIHRAPPLFAGGERLHRDSCHTHTHKHPSSTTCLSPAALMADKACLLTDNSLLCFTIESKPANWSAAWVGPPHNTDLHNGSIQATRELFSVTLITEHMEVECRPSGRRSSTVSLRNSSLAPAAAFCVTTNSTLKHNWHLNVFHSTFHRKSSTGEKFKDK